jgi:hypothetical protein
MGKPVKSFRAGAVEAAIFENERTVGGKKLKMSNVVFRRSYKDKDGNWQNSDSFGINDVPKVELLLKKSYEFMLVGERAEEEPAEDS